MGLVLLDRDAECPDCGHRGAWAETVTHNPTRERFRCANCEAAWVVTR